MKILVIGQLEFDGPFRDPAELQAKPGIYAILSQHRNDEFELIDICESARLDHILDTDEYTTNHLFYEETCSGVLSVAVHYTENMNLSERCQLKNQLLAELNEQFLYAAC